MNITFDPNNTAYHPTMLSEYVVPVPGTTTLSTLNGAPAVVLKRVSSVNEALACGGCVVFVMARSSSSPEADLEPIAISGLAGQALAHFSATDPVIGVKLTPTFSAVTGDFVSAADNTMYVDANASFGASPIRFAEVHAGVTSRAGAGTPFYADVEVLVMGWVTRALTGSFFQANMNWVATPGSCVRAPGPDPLAHLYSEYDTNLFSGGVAVLAPYKVRMRELLSSAKADFLGDATGDALEVLSSSYDEHVALTPVEVIIQQPMVIAFSSNFTEVMVGLTTTNDAVSGMLGDFVSAPGGFGPAYSLWAENNITAFTTSHASDYDTAFAALPSRDPKLAYNATPGSVINYFVLPSVEGLEFNRTFFSSESLPGRISGTTAATFIGSAFPIQYATGYGVAANQDFEGYVPMHPTQILGQTPKIETSGTGEMTVVQTTPKAKYEPRYSWSSLGGGVYGAVMSAFAAIDTRARNKARAM